MHRRVSASPTRTRMPAMWKTSKSRKTTTANAAPTISLRAKTCNAFRSTKGATARDTVATVRTREIALLTSHQVIRLALLSFTFRSLPSDCKYLVAASNRSSAHSTVNTQNY